MSMGLLLLLAACSEGASTSTRELADIADVNGRNALARVAALESRVSELEERVASQSRMLEATVGSLEEARGNHTSLLATFNSNADKSNARDAAQDDDLVWLLRRNGVQR